MATEAWIDSAARPDRTPGATFTYGDHLLVMTEQQPDAERLERERAARYVRRHAGDAADLLDILGLVDARPDPLDEATKRCRCCDEVRGGREFYRDARRPDGLSSYCKPCKRGMALDYQRRKRGADG